MNQQAQANLPEMLAGEQMGTGSRQHLSGSLVTSIATAAVTEPSSQVWVTHRTSEGACRRGQTPESEHAVQPQQVARAPPGMGQVTACSLDVE